MDKTKEHGTLRKRIFGGAGVLLCVLLCVLPAPAALAACAQAAGSSASAAMRILGITLLAILWWAGEVVPDWLTTVVMMLCWVIVGRVPFTKAFASFASTSVWLIVGAFCLAAGITGTGFFKRISWFLIRRFSPTFSGQVLALLLVGTVCAPLIPSATAKAVLGATIANNIADAMEYPAGSRGRCGLFIASFIGFSATTPAFMSGSVFTYTMLGALPGSARAGISWLSWLLAMLPWLAIIVVGFFAVIKLTASPKEASHMTPQYIQEQYEKLGSFDRKERCSAILLAGAVILWILESRLGIDASVTAMLAAALCFGLRLLEPKDISTAVPWGLVIFLGGVLNLGTILSMVGLDAWIQALLSPLFLSISSPYLIVLVLSVAVLLLRLVMVSQSATVILMMAIVTPVLASVGVSPFVAGLVILGAEQCWFLPFQNVVFTPALSCMDGTLKHGQTVRYCVFFELLSLLAFFASVPYWRLLGIL